ncbi:MAG: site-specific DNA-methyltransferase [Synergistaceae bacterium]|nr:site-specific DNA-methyltransferase [Synergistaceae bacterium]
MYSIEQIKAMGKNKTKENFSRLLRLFFIPVLPLEIKREVVSSIGRYDYNDEIYDFISLEAFNNNNHMELIYQMFRTCLYKSSEDERFEDLRQRIIACYDNEVINKANVFYNFKGKNKAVSNLMRLTTPMLLVGDAEETLAILPDNSVQLIFTSPPYYNAKEYSDYCSYDEYLAKMKSVLLVLNRVLEEGRFIVINVSPVITKRLGREFESIRYPIHYDFHRILTATGFHFIDEIQWIKPEPSVPDRISGYRQTRKPLSYKPNCVTESIMVYRKNADFLLDLNMKQNKDYDRHEDEDIDTSNCWYIAPSRDKNHPAVFPEELARKVLKYYSFEGDAVLDPFAGSGTTGRVARNMNRVPIMCEINKDYAEAIDKANPNYYKRCEQM